MSQMSNAIKGLVSKKKRRYKDDEFDLDLTIIRPYIIAMGYPADNLEGVFRNRIDDVARFLDRDYAERYRIYNLCSERGYDAAKFHNRVVRFPFDDHHPPKLSMMMQFCEDARRWLVDGDSRVVVVQCKAGKGRTGVMICAFLVYAGMVSIDEHRTVLQALRHYDKLRTYNFKGVTIPSQIRYVFYFGELVKRFPPGVPFAYSPAVVALRGVRLSSSPAYNANGLSCPHFRVRQRSLCNADGSAVPRDNNEIVEIYRSDVIEAQKKDSPMLFWLEQPKDVCGDLLFEFFNRSIVNKKERMCHLWLNTYFLVHPVQHQQTEQELDLQEAQRGANEAVNLTDAHHGNNRAYTKERTVSTGRMGKALLRYSDLQTTPDIVDLHPGDLAPVGAEECIFVELPKAYLDKAAKDKEHFPPNFSIRLYFSLVNESQSSNAVSTLQLQTGFRNGTQLNEPASSKHAPPDTLNVYKQHSVSKTLSYSVGSALLSPMRQNADAAVQRTVAQGIMRPLGQPIPTVSAQTQMYDAYSSSSSSSNRIVHAQRASPLSNQTYYNYTNQLSQTAKSSASRVNSNNVVMQHASGNGPVSATSNFHVHNPVLRSNSSATRLQPTSSTNAFLQSQTDMDNNCSSPRTPNSLVTLNNVRYRPTDELKAHQASNARHGLTAPPMLFYGATANNTDAKLAYSGISSPNRVLVAPIGASSSASASASASTAASAACANNAVTPRIANATQLAMVKIPPTVEAEGSDDDGDRTADDTDDTTDETDDDDLEIAQTARQFGDMRCDENSNTCASKRAGSSELALSATDTAGLNNEEPQNYSLISQV